MAREFFTFVLPLYAPDLLVLAAVYFCYAIGKLQTHCETLWEGTTSWL